jgi:hypothetical protein
MPISDTRTNNPRGVTDPKTGVTYYDLKDLQYDFLGEYPDWLRDHHREPTPTWDVIIRWEGREHAFTNVKAATPALALKHAAFRLSREFKYADSARLVRIVQSDASQYIVKRA